ncbi:unnamed protein product, partial [Brassica oleracea]
RNRHRNPWYRKIKRAMDPLVDGVDMISSMPHEILHHILSFIRTQYAIRTSVLSRGWRHIWCHTPFLDFDSSSLPYIQLQHLSMTLSSHHNTQLSLYFCCIPSTLLALAPLLGILGSFQPCSNGVSWELAYSGLLVLATFAPRFPASFKRSSLLVQMYPDSLLHRLGCILLQLALFSFFLVSHWQDLNQSSCFLLLHLHTEIVAPHIHYLSLSNSSEPPPTLVDVSSLTEASIDIISSVNLCRLLNADFLQTMVLKMLAKLQNVKRLTFTGPILEILSLAELHGVPFPTFKVETLTVETKFTRYVIPGLARLLQNSPELKKLIAHAGYQVGIQDRDLDRYMDSEGLNRDECWRSNYEVFPTSLEFCRMIRCKDEMWKLMASFMEMVMRNVKTLETLVVGLKYIVTLLVMQDGLKTCFRCFQRFLTTIMFPLCSN